MPCYHPVKGYRSRDLNPSGKRSIVFSASEGYKDLPVEIQCGQCVGCRLDRSRKWAVRCIHEASLYDHNCFITLTYSPEKLPPFGSLRVEDFQKFMKRLRKKFSGESIRYFHCGEYGDQQGRPHYHACLFNLDFKDKYHWKTVRGEKYYRSETLEELWQEGSSMIGSLTFRSAAYVARYIMKKRLGRDAQDHYEVVDRTTGEILGEVKPEYVTMSRRPGIGKGWFEKFHSDCYPKDFVTVNGKKMGIPKFYDSQFEILSPGEFAKVKAQRQVAAGAHADNNTPERHRVREECHILRAQQLKRSLDDGGT